MNAGESDSGLVNRLLLRLPNHDRERLLPLLQPVSLDAKDVLFEQGATMEYAYFPQSGVVSFIAMMRNGRGVEVGTIGNEGMIGLRLLADDEIARNKVIVQVPGAALKMSAADLKNEIQQRSELYRVLLRFVDAYLSQVTQSVACNRLHSGKQRCCRWLLMTHDRVVGDRFQLTQTFLAQMLGVRRATVSEITSALQREGVIQYEYGHITITDRSKLEAASCECYFVVRDEFDRLLA